MVRTPPVGLRTSGAFRPTKLVIVIAVLLKDRFPSIVGIVFRCHHSNSREQGVSRIRADPSAVLVTKTLRTVTRNEVLVSWFCHHSLSSERGHNEPMG